MNIAVKKQLSNGIFSFLRVHMLREEQVLVGFDPTSVEGKKCFESTSKPAS
jgi:hypothetical protein